VAWFAQYGVRECWLLHQFDKRLEVLVFSALTSLDDAGRGRARTVSERRVFEARDPIRSTVLPDFSRTLGAILRWTS
jgi:hypothetical protein